MLEVFWLFRRAPGSPREPFDVVSAHGVGVVQREKGVSSSFLHFPLSCDAAAAAFCGEMQGLGKEHLDGAGVMGALVGFDKGGVGAKAFLSVSVAPVFMISAIGLLLNSMALRYGRVIDRTRQLLRDGDKIYRRDIESQHLNFELLFLYRRARLLRTTVVMAAASIFLVSITIALIFLEHMFHVILPFFAASTFLASVGCLIVSVLFFIHDFTISLKLIKHDLFASAPPNFPTDKLEGPADGASPLQS